MKLKINIKFTDKYTGDKYKDGSIVEFDDKRAEELLADKRNLVSKVEEEKKPARKRKKSEK